MKSPSFWQAAVVTFMLLGLAMPAMGQRSDGQAAPHLVSGAVSSGTGFLRAGDWAQFRTTAVNPTDDAVQLIVASTLGNGSHIQFGTRIWLPPHSTRVVDYPVRMEDEPPRTATKGLLHQTLLLEPSGQGGERKWLSRETGQTLVADHHLTLAVLGSTDDRTLDLMSLVRKTIEGEQGIRSIRPEMAPRYAQAWQPLDALVVSQTPALDAQQFEALRNWVLQGGHLWLMLDDLDEAFASQLLGDLWDVAIVGRTAVSQVVLGSKRRAGDAYDEPVKFTRIMPGSMQLHARSGQWPLIASMPAGQGTVVVTTLEPRAWMSKQMFPAMERVGELMLEREKSSELQMRHAAADLAASSIGRPIVSRSVVLAVLITMIAMMIVAGLLLQRAGKLEWMGVASLVLAVLISLILLGIGRSSQGQVPLTLSSVRFMHVTPELDQAVSHGTAAIYSPSTQEEPLTAEAGGLLWPDLTGLQGRTVRLLMTDLHQWQWQGVEFSSGAIRTGRFQGASELAEHVSVQGVFGQEGLELTTRLGVFDGMHDPFIAAAGGIMGLDRIAPPETGPPEAGPGEAGPGGASDVSTATAASHWLASSRNVLPRGTYSIAKSDMLSDRQQQLAGFYKAIFSSPDALPEQIMLMGWSEQLRAGITFEGRQAERHDNALVMIPVKMRRPSPGSEVTVPATFTQFEVVKVPGESAPATIYNANMRQWITDLSDARRFALGFRLPPSVVPMEVTALTLSVQIKAPGRTLEVYAPDRLRGQPLAQVANPSGQVRIDIGPEAKLRTNAQGQVVLVLKVGEHARNQTWSLFDLSMEVKGRVTAPEADAMPGG